MPAGTSMPYDHDGPRQRRGPSSWARVGVVAVAVILVVIVILSRPAGQQMLPDLGVAQPADFALARDSERALSLRMSVTAVNVGDGPLIIDAAVDRSQGVWEVDQIIEREVRGVDTRQVEAAVSYGGDGHDHLHLLDSVTYVFDPAGENRRDQKVGFCFFDRDEYRPDIPGAATAPRFEAQSCGDETATRFSMGLSVGWGDEYAWHLPGQTIDIDGVGEGQYRIEFVADPDGLYAESNEDNNTAWAILELSDLDGDFPLVTVVDSGTELDDDA